MAIKKLLSAKPLLIILRNQRIRNINIRITCLGAVKKSLLGWTGNPSNRFIGDRRIRVRI